MIDLQKFCSTDELRSHLHHPFSDDAFTYSTNGHIAVRVAKRDDIAKQAKPNMDPINKMIDGFIGDFIPMARFVLPEWQAETRKIECGDCGGTGRHHDCPSCTCLCPDCRGTGLETRESECSVALLGGTFNIKYLRLVAELPQVEIGVNAKDKHLMFRFEGGDGVLLGLRSPSETHFAIEPKKAAAP